MATHNTITNVPFSFEVLDAGMGTNTLSNLLTAEWQPIITVNTYDINMRVTGLQVHFVADTGDQTFTFDPATFNTSNSGPNYFAAAQAFPDLSYSAGVNELTSVVISGNFTYLYNSASPINSLTEVYAGVRYNKTGAAVGGVLTLGGANDPSAESVDSTVYNGANNACTIGHSQKIRRFGPQKVKFHREYALVTAACCSNLS